MINLRFVYLSKKKTKKKEKKNSKELTFPLLVLHYTVVTFDVLIAAGFML